MKHIFVILALISSALAAQADERPVKFGQLPAKAQELISKHFEGFTLSYAKYDNDITDQSYDVIFTDGTKIEFSRRGEWEKIECRREARVPQTLLPAAMVEYIAVNHKDAGVVEIERDMHSLDVKLSNGAELVFNNNGTFKRYDK